MNDTTQRFLDSMDGTAMVLDRTLVILHIGQPNWTRFLDENRAPNGTLAAESINATLGRPITEFMAGETLRQTFAGLFRGVLDGRRDAIRLLYRCDAPGLRRDMRLAVTRINWPDGNHQLLYQSVMLRSEPRVPLPFLDARIAEEGPDILTMCAICARVAWPVGAPSGAREWIDPVDYYRRGGTGIRKISHGFCERCHARLSDEG